jgi:hypothetical protein
MALRAGFGVLRRRATALAAAIAALAAGFAAFSSGFARFFGGKFVGIPALVSLAACLASFLGIELMGIPALMRGAPALARFSLEGADECPPDPPPECNVHTNQVAVCIIE